MWYNGNQTANKMSTIRFIRDTTRDQLNEYASMNYKHDGRRHAGVVVDAHRFRTYTRISRYVVVVVVVVFDDNTVRLPTTRASELA